MISLYLVKDDEKVYKSDPSGRKITDDRQYLETQKVLFKSRRPALMPYEDPILSVAKRVLFMAYYILFPQSQARTMTIQLAERVNFDKSALQPTAAFVEIEAGQDIHIYSTALTLTAQLRGLRWLMFHYRLLTYLAFTFLFWVCEVLFMCLAWLIWSATNTPKNTKPKGDNYTDGEYDDDDEYDEYSEKATGSGASGRQATIKREPDIKVEDDDDEPEKMISDIPMGGEAEADDEDDFDEEDNDAGGKRRRDSAMGTSYRHEGSESVRQRASRNIVE